VYCSTESIRPPTTVPVCQNSICSGTPLLTPVAVIWQWMNQRSWPRFQSASGTISNSPQADRKSSNRRTRPSCPRYSWFSGQPKKWRNDQRQSRV
jgi:hypothetical protein